mmetsp:Transcript_18357/g.52460  ORF Transcript_18357/g.52460 Transcript_18357/m.52460 type:complete len:126 (+) Transcript_18357:1057-1434(+)
MLTHFAHPTGVGGLAFSLAKSEKIIKQVFSRTIVAPKDPTSPSSPFVKDFWIQPDMELKAMEELQIAATNRKKILPFMAQMAKTNWTKLNEFREKLALARDEKEEIVAGIDLVDKLEIDSRKVAI